MHPILLWIFVVVMLTAPARLALGQEVQTGVGLICDEQSQVETLLTADINEAAIQKVNETSPNACGIVAVAYFRGDTVSTLTTKHGTAEVVHILVIAVNLGQGWVRGTPLPQFTFFLKHERGA